MKVKTFLFSMFLLHGVLFADAKVVKGFNFSKDDESTGYITFVVESVDYRPDLTRIYGKLKGNPHTSERIDELIIILPSGKQHALMDIDGVDLKRWFQWEDNGLIDVEIDFPVIKECDKFTLKSSGPKGISQTKIAKEK